MKGEDFAETFSRFVNGCGSAETNAAVERMCNDHRTLQQGMMRFCMTFIERMAQKTDRDTDMRNETAVKVAKEIVSKVPNRALPLI